MTTATPTKLRNGEWGARTVRKITDGEIIEIRTRGGKTWQARVVKVVWSGEGTWIAATKSADGYVSAKRDARGYVTDRAHAEGYCGYPCPVTGRKCCPKNGPCHDCQ